MGLLYFPLGTEFQSDNEATNHDYFNLHYRRIKTSYIREYGSTLYVGMVSKKNGRPYISTASDKLVLYTDKF